MCPVFFARLRSKAAGADVLIEVRSSGGRIRLRNGLLDVEPGPEARDRGATPFRVRPSEVTRLVLETPHVTLSAAALVALARS